MKSVRIIKTSIAFFFGLSLANIAPSFAENIPEIYKFAPKESFFSINIKSSERAWSALTQNPTFKSLKLFSEFSKSNEFDVMEDKQIRDNIGDNILISVPEFKSDQSKVATEGHLVSAKSENNDSFIMAVQFKNKNKHSYIKSKIMKLFSGKADARVVETKFRDANVISVLAKNKNDYNFKPSFYVFLNNYLITTNNVNSVQDSVKSYYNGDSLVDLDNFTRSFDKLGSTYQIQMYINMKKLSSLIFDNPADNDLKALKNQGIFINNSILMNLNVAAKNLELRTYMIPDKTNKFAKTLLEARPGNLSITNFLPKESVAFMGTVNFNMAEYLNSINSLKQSGKGIKLKSIKENLGFDLEELYNNIKGENGLVAFSTQSNPIIPGFAIFLTPKDSEKMLKTINSLRVDFDSLSSKFDKGRRKQRSQISSDKKGIMTFSETKNYKGYKIVSTNEISNLEQMSIRPVYSVINEKVIVASNEEVIKIIIDRIKNNAPDFTLEKNPYFESLKEELGNNNNSLGYLNLDTIVSMIGTFNNGKSADMRAMITNLKKFHALGFNSVNDKDGILSRIILLADIDKLDFNKLFPEAKSKMNIDIKNNKPTYY